MKIIKGVIIGLIIAAAVTYAQTFTYTNAQIQALLDLVNNRVETSAGAGDEGKLVKLDATGKLDSSIVSAGSGTVVISGTPVSLDFARFTNDVTIEGRSYAETRADLNLEVGRDIQSWNAALDILAAISYSANMLSFLTAANYAAMRTQLGLVIGENVQAYDADLTTYAGITPSANVQSLLGAADYAAMRGLMNLEAGTDFYAIAAAQSILTNSAGLAGALSDETGTGLAVFNTDPVFAGFPVTPSTAPDADYEVANKKYVDDAVFSAGSGDVTGVGDCADGACLDGSSDGGSYIRIYDGDSHYGEIQIPDVAGNVVITTPSTTSTLLATDGTGAGLTGVDAITGDSATAFFDAGTIETNFGGTGADLSAVTGIMGITAGAYTDVDTAAELETLAGLGAFANEYLDDADQATMQTTLGLGTGDSPQFTGINVGAAADTTITREGAGDILIEGNHVYRVGGTDVSDADMVDAHSHAADSIDAITEIAAALKTGSDTKLVTGTAGTSGYYAAWDANGDIVNGVGVPISSPLSANLVVNNYEIQATGANDVVVRLADDAGAQSLFVLDSAGGTAAEISSDGTISEGGTSLVSKYQALEDQGLSTTDSPTFVQVTVTGSGNGGFEIDPLPDTTQTCEGIIITVTAGTTIAFGDALSLQGSSGKYILADADAAGTQLACQAVACEAGSDTDAIEVMLQGFIRDDSAYNFDISASGIRYLILDDTAGDFRMQDGDSVANVAGAIPAATGDFIQPVGYAVHNDVWYFSPQLVPTVLQ